MSPNTETAIREVIDVDVPETWPGELRSLVRGLADELRGSTTSTGDLRPAEQQAQQVRRVLHGRYLRAYHATRLLDAEVEAIQQEGLRLLTPEFVQERVEQAHEEGAVSTEERDALADSHVFAINWQVPPREDQVCLFLGKSAYQDRAGLGPLLHNWGGEAISRTAPDWVKERLQEIGEPAVVVVNMRYLDDPDLYVFPDIVSVLAGSVLELSDVEATVHSPSAVDPDQVVDVWKPGHQCFEQHLPWVQQ